MLNRDEKLLAEAYQRIMESEDKCSHAKNGCDCDECEDCKDNKKVEEAAKPDYLDVDEDGDKDEPMKKALKDKEEVKESNGESDQLSQQALQIMADLKARDPRAYDQLIARLNDLSNASEQPDEYEHKGWPGDGSGEDDFADYNQNEGNDY